MLERSLFHSNIACVQKLLELIILLSLDIHALPHQITVANQDEASPCPYATLSSVKGSSNIVLLPVSLFGVCDGLAMEYHSLLWSDSSIIVLLHFLWA